MPYNSIVMNSNQGEQRVKIPVIPQGIHEPRFAILCERLVLHIKNGRDIGREFRPDKIGIHPVLFDGWTDKGMYATPDLRIFSRHAISSRKNEYPAN
jgi:hypothetical protein